MNVNSKLKDHISVAERLSEASEPLDPESLFHYYFIQFWGSLVVQRLSSRFPNKQQKMDPSCNELMSDIDVQTFCLY